MTLRKLFEGGVVALATLPAKNDYLLSADGKIDLNKLDALDAYTVPLIGHDYGAITPIMWNTAYETADINIRNIMVVANPKDAELILDDLAHDPKYLGGGAGVGFKEAILPYVRPEPSDLQSVNIIVNRKGTLYGYNTDAAGLVKSIEDELSTISKNLEGTNIAMYGAGGVAKELGRLLGRKNVKNLRIINRTASKAVNLAYTLHKEFPQMTTIGVGEDLSRGIILNSYVPVDVIVNTTDKGSDSNLNTSCYEAEGPSNETNARASLRILKDLRPDVVIVDIVLPKKHESISLRLARTENIAHLVNGKPMVINQAAPAYKLIEEQNPSLHKRKFDEDELLGIFRNAAHR